MNPNLARTLAFRKAQTQTPEYELALSTKERSDCTVRALQILTGRPYVECHSAVKALGRRFRVGLSSYALADYVKLFSKFGCVMERVSRAEPQGRYLVLTWDHAAALVDGEWVNGRGDAMITDIYRVG